MDRMGAQGTRAIDVARRAGVVHTVHEYAHDARASLREGGHGYALEAVEALGVDAARVFKTIVVSVDGRLGLAIVPADAEVDLKAVADALGGRRAVDRGARRGREGDGLRAGRDQPARDPPGACPRCWTSRRDGFTTIHVSAGRRGLEIELAAADLVALTKGSMAPVARRG